MDFIRKRYNKLVESLVARVEPKLLDEALVQQGMFCGSGFAMAQAHKGDVDGFIKEFGEKAHQTVTYDRAKGELEVAGPEIKACYCPLVDPKLTPKVMCNCSTGWHRRTWETVLGKPVQVTLKDSLLYGHKRCVFAVKIVA